MVNNVNLKLFAILAKRYILDAWPGPKSVSAGE